MSITTEVQKGKIFSDSNGIINSDSLIIDDTTGNTSSIVSGTVFNNDSVSLANTKLFVNGDITSTGDMRVKNAIRFGSSLSARIEGETSGMVTIPDFTTHNGGNKLNDRDWWYKFGSNTSGSEVKWDSYASRIGLYVDSGCLAGYFLGSSDSRIKSDITDVDKNNSLRLINAIESKKYHYIDPSKKNEYKTTGFIAQQVREVFPEAVTIKDNFIPDELRILDEWNGTKIKVGNLDLSGNYTGRLKFYVIDDDIGDENHIEGELDENNECDLGKKYDHVLLYGKEVDDFHCLNKDRIFALHHSGIQELSRQNDLKTQEITELKEKLQGIETENAQLKADMALVKQKLGL